MAKGWITGQEGTSPDIPPRACHSGSHQHHSCSHPCHLPKATQDSPGEDILRPTLHPAPNLPLDSLTLAASVVIQQDVARGAGAEVCARLVHTFVLAEELGEAALVHIWG